MNIITDTIKNINESTNQKLFSVYKHTFPNGKVYIGLTSKATPEHRWGLHGTHYGVYMTNAIQKYGWENVQHEIIASGLSKDAACNLEIKLIAEYNSTNPDLGYNLMSGGQHATHSDCTKAKISASTLGYRHTDESKAKIAAASKVRKHPPVSDEQRAKVSASLLGRIPWNKGIPVPDEQKARQSAAMSGRVYSDETLAKMSAAQLGRKRSETFKANVAGGLQKMSPEAKAKQKMNISIAHKGKVLSDEHKANIAAGLRRRKNSKEA